MSEKFTELSYMLFPQWIRSTGYRKWFSLTASASRVSHHFQGDKHDLLCLSQRRGVTLNLRNRFTLGWYVDRDHRWEKIARPECELALAVNAGATPTGEGAPESAQNSSSSSSSIALRPQEDR